jgi:hypothetical protein
MSDFDFRLLDDYSGVFAFETLDAFARRLPDATGLRLLAHQFDRTVFMCDGFEVVACDGRSVVRIKRLGAVLGETFVVGKKLETEVLPYQQSSIFLRLGPREVPLNPDDPGLLWFDPNPSLGPRPEGDERVLEVARLDWSSRDGIASLDTSWWPETVRIASDFRGLAAATRLADRFPSPSPSLKFFFSRLGRYAWTDFLPQVIRALEDRLRDDPERLAALGRVAAAETPEAVRGLLTLLEDGGQLPLPPTLDQDRLQLIRILDRRSEDRVKRGVNWIHRCSFSGIAQTGWWLVLLLRHGDERGSRKVVVRIGDSESKPGDSRPEWESHLHLSQPRACTWIDRPGDIQVEVNDAVIEAAGAYRERIDQKTGSLSH